MPHELFGFGCAQSTPVLQAPKTVRFFKPTFRSPKTTYELRSRDSGGPACATKPPSAVVSSARITVVHRCISRCIARA
jgi:hypothetical protein